MQCNDARGTETQQHSRGTGNDGKAAVQMADPTHALKRQAYQSTTASMTAAHESPKPRGVPAGSVPKIMVMLFST
jgi:hypothetical protein